MSEMGARMIKSIKFRGESIEELEVWYYAQKHECSAAEFAQQCGKLVRADFGLASLYEIKFEKFTPGAPDDFMKERITAALSAAALSDEPRNFAMGGENDWDWQECSFEASGQRFLRIWATSA